MSTQKPNLDSITSLCLACSSSLPPKANVDSVFITSCCRQPICSSCISSNPRLARYNPCLSCLGGVDVVNARKTTAGKLTNPLNKVPIPPTEVNIDGAVRDEDTYVIGDDDDDNEDEDGFGGRLDSSPPPPYPLSSDSSKQSSETSTPPNEPFGKNDTDTNPGVNPNNPYEYYIKKGDTLQGIALKFGVDGRELCRLNRLPPTTLSTTPYLLHTRGILTLPPNAKLFDKFGNKFSNDPRAIEEEKARAVGRIRSRAEGRLQLITKETDWRVLKTYVALAEDPDELAKYDVKRKESGTTSNPSHLGPSSSSLEAAAVDMYMEDEEWERTEGRKMAIPTLCARK